MFEYARLYFIYRTLTFKAIRFVIPLFFTWIIVTEITSKNFTIGSTKIPLFLLLVFLMIEIFFRAKIAKKLPKVTVAENDGKNIFESFSLKALDIYFKSPKLSSLVNNLLGREEVRFILNKSDIQEKELPITDIQKQEVFNTAFLFVKEINGKVVTVMDLIASYILLSESKTNLLFNKKLKREEFINILKWARYDFRNEENPKPRRVEFWGEGIAEDWVSGWTLETKKYTKDITEKVVSDKPTLVGRISEYKQVVEILSKNEKNNVILVGEPGSGKTTLVEELAFESFAGKLGGTLHHKRFLELLTGLLLAGASQQADLSGKIEACY